VERDELDVAQVRERALLDEVVGGRGWDVIEQASAELAALRRHARTRAVVQAVRVGAVDRESSARLRLHRGVPEDVVRMPVGVEDLEQREPLRAQRVERRPLAHRRIDEQRVAAIVHDDVHAVVVWRNAPRDDPHFRRV